MLADKNKLNDETIDQLSGGEDFIDFSDGEILNKTMQYFRCKKCYGSYKAYIRSESGLCPNCEPKPFKTGVTIGDIKTTVPDLSNKDKLVKIH